jgi:hypothetical protein
MLAFVIFCGAFGLPAELRMRRRNAEDHLGNQNDPDD